MRVVAKFYVRVEEKSIEAECPGWVTNGSPVWASESPLLGVKRKSISGDWTSACSQEQKSAWGTGNQGFPHPGDGMAIASVGAVREFHT